MNGRHRRGRPPHPDVLTPTEWQVVHAVQHGLSNRAIAMRRGISTDAVKYHVTNAMAKLGLTDRRALRRWFREPRSSALEQKEKVMAELKLGALAQISRTVRDIKESELWYRQILGLRGELDPVGRKAVADEPGADLIRVPSLAEHRE